MSVNGTEFATAVTPARILVALTKVADQVPFTGSIDDVVYWSFPFQMDCYQGVMRVSLFRPRETTFLRIYTTLGLHQHCDPAVSAELLVYRLNPEISNAMLSQQVLDDGRVLITCESSFLADTATDEQLRVWCEEASLAVVDGIGEVIDAYVRWGADE